MDLSLILSMVAIVVSFATSIIILLLTEFHGPNISLLNVPKFEITDKTFNERYNQEFTPRWFNPNNVPLVFANYGGKAGTIVSLKLDFVPHKVFESFLESGYSRFEEPSLPVIIREGDNQDLPLTSLDIRTIDWKKKALAEVLDPSLKINDLIIKSLQRSKEEFERFCDFLEKSQELGKVSCTIVLTKGRFRTKVKSETVFQDVPIEINYVKATSSLRDCLRRWENLKPTKAELLNDIERGLKELTKELLENLATLEAPVSEENINSYQLRVDRWNNFHRFWDSDEEKIRWFLIESEKGLRKDLIKLYQKIIECNNQIAELRSHGEGRTQEHFKPINIKLKELRLEIQTMRKRLSALHKRSIS